jgi:peptidoglycan/xylan/chitin deacetylase (PgdA/CDA1 family)
MTTTQVPVLITWDIDPNIHFDLTQKRQALQTALELCRELEIPATFLFVAQEAASYPEEIAEMRRVGHEIGCHGLTHADEEEYDRMPAETQRIYIERATHLLEEQADTSITAFRGPRVKISSVTLKLLVEYGYLTDSSVCSQRLDLVSSNLINPGWLVAPRSPYHPHRDSAFKRGDLDILEVPVSALIAPFISSLLYVLKLPAMKMLFRLLYAEARRKEKPIVYLAHPEEFGPQSWAPLKLSGLSFKNLRTHGLVFRKHLNEPNPETRLRLNRALFSYIAAFPGVRFMTMREYVLQSSRPTVTND